MAVYKEITVTKNDDQKSLAKKLYRYSEDLRFTLSNLDEDNFSREFLNWKHEREEKTRQMQRDSEKMKIRFEDTEKEIYSEINQTEEKINMLVERGSVVSTMLSRMSLYGEHIDLKTGHITIDAQNFKLDADGNATFSGTITGGSMRLGTGFVVDGEGNAVIQGDLKCNVLNPRKGIVVGGDVEVEGDEGYGYCTIGGELTGDDAFIMETLSCKRLKETSDARLKERIKQLTPPDMRRITPVAYRFRKSGQRSMGFIAQELKGPVRCEPHMRVAYGQIGAMWAAAIQENQRRIDRIRKEVERREESVVF